MGRQETVALAGQGVLEEAKASQGCQAPLAHLAQGVLRVARGHLVYLGRREIWD